MTELIARRCHVAGRVQGVFYRASTRDHARELGVTGYARNLPDGRVEVVLEGPDDAVARVLAALDGPRAPGRVVGVDSRDEPAQGGSVFTME
jgi:acylphosphatase